MYGLKQYFQFADEEDVIRVQESTFYHLDKGLEGPTNN